MAGMVISRLEFDCGCEVWAVYQAGEPDRDGVSFVHCPCCGTIQPDSTGIRGIRLKRLISRFPCAETGVLIESQPSFQGESNVERVPCELAPGGYHTVHGGFLRFIGDHAPVAAVPVGQEMPARGLLGGRETG